MINGHLFVIRTGAPARDELNELEESVKRTAVEELTVPLMGSVDFDIPSTGRELGTNVRPKEPHNMAFLCPETTPVAEADTTSGYSSIHHLFVW